MCAQREQAKGGREGGGECGMEGTYNSSKSCDVISSGWQRPCDTTRLSPGHPATPRTERRDSAVDGASLRFVGVSGRIRPSHALRPSCVDSVCCVVTCRDALDGASRRLTIGRRPFAGSSRHSCQPHYLIYTLRILLAPRPDPPGGGQTRRTPPALLDGLRLLRRPAGGREVGRPWSSASQTLRGAGRQWGHM